jgi:acetate kinase
MISLVFNAGSTSLKFRFGEANAKPLWQGEAEGFGTDRARLTITDAGGAPILEGQPATLHDAANAILKQAQNSGQAPDGIGHRFVHGGASLTSHCRIDASVQAALQRASQLAPLHNPPALEVLALAQKALPDCPQIACLDTVFHAQMPEVARRFPLPSARLGQEIRRYGFHGLSCESILQQLGTPPARLIIAHLGGGASVTAVKDGVSVDTSMGLTPTGGVMMESRSGDLDPGLLLYLLRHGETVDSLEKMLNRESGVAGVSGHGGDLRQVRASGDSAARLALEMFVTSIAKGIAAMATVLGGVDCLVFTGGIGQHDGQTREAILARLSCLGSFAVAVLPAQEEDMIARHAARILGV